LKIWVNNWLVYSTYNFIRVDVSLVKYLISFSNINLQTKCYTKKLVEFPNAEIFSVKIYLSFPVCQLILSCVLVSPWHLWCNKAEIKL